jgi:2-amino-4-hydroxy-6-hydroxymethyldihydropteridine diphosphokinase
MTTVYLSLGSNLGDREAALRAALAALRTEGVDLVRCSSVYETEPVGLRPQPWFLNLVAELETALDPEELLRVIHRVEAALGRARAVRWGPRSIDIDILLYGTVTLATDVLTIPHPALASRRFVLEPLAELAPDLALPGGGTVSDALAAAGDEPAVRRIGALR